MFTYRILGSGNKAPNKLAIKPIIPPIVTTHFDVIHPISWKAWGSGASEFYEKHFDYLIKLKSLQFSHQKIVRPHEGQQGDAEISDEDDKEREEKCSWHSLLRIAHFLACRRYAIETNETEEARRGAFQCSGKPERKESSGACRVCVFGNVNRIDLPIFDVGVEKNSDNDVSNDAEIETAENVVYAC